MRIKSEKRLIKYLIKRRNSYGRPLIETPEQNLKNFKICNVKLQGRSKKVIL